MVGYYKFIFGDGFYFCIWFLKSFFGRCVRWWAVFFVGGDVTCEILFIELIYWIINVSFTSWNLWWLNLFDNKLWVPANWNQFYTNTSLNTGEVVMRFQRMKHFCLFNKFFHLIFIVSSQLSLMLNFSCSFISFQFSFLLINVTTNNKICNTN